MSTLLLNARVATMADGYGLIDDGAVLVSDGVIEWVGPRAEAPHGDASEDLGGALLTPGLVDCHTHLVFGGDRSAEFEARREGATYEEVHRAGGGIMSTVRATRDASTDDLLTRAAHRMGWLSAGGVTTVEVKTGYGLDVETELRMLEVIERLHGPDVIPTLLAHTVPAGEDRDAWVDAFCEVLIPAATGRVGAVDVFCETIGLTEAETRRIFEAATRSGIAVKVHADQLTLGAGCHLAAEFGALSADHLEHADEAAVGALGVVGTVAVLIPGASSFLDERTLPPVVLFREFGVPMAVATDLNPGTAPLASPTLAMNLACTRFGLTPVEALQGMTTHAAAALGLADRGVIAPGMRADLAAWDVAHPAELSYWMGAPLCLATWTGGRRSTRGEEGIRAVGRGTKQTLHSNEEPQR